MKAKKYLKKKVDMSGYKAKTQTEKNIAWFLPRPKPDHYKGGKPLYCEEWLIDLARDILSKEPDILNLFCGMNKYGFRIDIKPEVNPDLLCDAHNFADKLEGKKFNLIIGNPPFGTRNTLSVKFFKKAITMGDAVAFILPISQYKNNQQMYEFNLIHSEILPIIEYSGVKLQCCFNIYTRPKNGLNKAPIDYTLKDVTVLEYRRGGKYPKPINYDFGMCAWGNVGKQVIYVGEYAQENYIVINNGNYRQKILDLMVDTDWKNLYPCISTAKIQTWKIYKYLKQQIPELL